MLLNGCNDLEINSVSELENLVVTVASGRVLKASSAKPRPSFTCRSYSGQTASLFYLSSDFSSAFEFEPVDYLRFVFQLEHHVDLRIGSTEFSIDPRQAGYVLPAGLPARETHPDGYRSLALRICPKRLQHLAERLLGDPIKGPIEFEQPDPLNSLFSEFVRGASVTIAREFKEVALPFQKAYWGNFEEAIAIRLLLYGQHSHAHLFRKRVPRSGRLERVEDYIRENWNKTLRMEDLAEVAGTSGRTVHNDFVRRYGETPHDFIKRLRLENARDMLSQTPAPSAMMVALRCGFTSFGHFARAYRNMFGELPSETTRRPRT